MNKLNEAQRAADRMLEFVRAAKQIHRGRYAEKVAPWVVVVHNAMAKLNTNAVGVLLILTRELEEAGNMSPGAMMMLSAAVVEVIDPDAARNAIAMLEDIEGDQR